jgi:hypothetical protein
VWHVKEPSLLKAISVKLRSKFAALSPVMVTAAGLLKNRQTAVNKHCVQNIGLKADLTGQQPPEHLVPPLVFPEIRVAVLFNLY